MNLVASGVSRITSHPREPSPTEIRADPRRLLRFMVPMRGEASWRLPALTSQNLNRTRPNRPSPGRPASTLMALDCLHGLAEDRPQPVFHQVDLVRVRPGGRGDLADGRAANDVEIKD